MNDASSPGDPRSRFRLWCALVIVAAAILSWRVHRGVEIDSNILHLLPATERDPVVEEIVEQLLQRDLTKAQRLVYLRELVRSGDDLPDELMDQALRKLMERVTE